MRFQRKLWILLTGIIIIRNNNMKKLLSILFVCIATSLFAQNIADTLHVAHYDLKLDIRDFSTRNIFGQADLTVVSKINQLDNIRLDLQGLTVDSVRANNRTVPFQQQGNKLNISTSILSQGDTVLFSIFYHGVPVHDARWGGFYFSGEYCYNLGVAFNFQPHNFGRCWFPCLDVFNDKSTYAIQVRTENGKMAVCDGLLTDSLTLEDNSKIWTWQLDSPIPTYLASIAVGDYRLYADTFHGLERVIPIQIYVQPSLIQNVAGSFVHLKDILRMYEHLFGPYRWQRVGYVGVNFTGGAMEHATNIAYPNFAINGNTEYESLFAHELFHHWFGDLITCNRAEEMWINEGFATYSEALVEELLQDNYNGYLRDMHRGVLKNLKTDDGGYFALDNVPQNVTYGTHSYDKGALIVHNLRSYLGDTLFFNGMRNMLNHYAFRNVSSQELFNYLSQVTGHDLTGFYEGWVHQSGFPQFSIDSIRSLENNCYRVYLHQKLHHADRFVNGNRIDLTFLSSERQMHTISDVSFSGEFGQVDVTLPFSPMFGMVDYPERLMDATVDYTRNMVSGESWSPADAFCTVMLDNFPDTVMVRLEHHLVNPDTPDQLPDGIYKLSDNHYWTMAMSHRTDVNTIPTGYLQFQYQRGIDNQLDYELFGNAEYNTDNLKLLYRADASRPWEVIPFIRKGTPYVGTLKTQVLLPGQYCLAVGDIHASIEGRSEEFLRIYPNPVRNQLNIQVDDDMVKNAKAAILDSVGRIIKTFRLRSGNNRIQVGNVPTGTYILMVNVNNSIATKQFVKE